MTTWPARLSTLIFTAGAIVAAMPLEAFAQGGYPSRTVRIVVVTAAGGGGDMVGRIIGQGLSERFGRQVVVENRTGASGIIGYEAVARSPADGYTLLLCAPTLAINVSTHSKLPYDAVRDFAPITQAVFSPLLLMAHPSLPAKSVKELIVFAKARPGEVFYGSAGYGTLPHLALELLSVMAQIRLVHVPYKGATPGVIDLIAGQVALMAPAMLTGVTHVRNGKLRALGVTSASRVDAAPDIPTIAEGGLPGYEAVVWYGLLAPATTPGDIITRLHKESVASLHAPQSKSRIASDGAEVRGNSPTEFTAFLNSEIVKWEKVARASGLKRQ